MMLYLLFSIFLSIGCSDATGEQKLPEPVLASIQQVVFKCLAKSQINAEDLTQKHASEYAENEGLKNILLCSLISSGFGNADGHIDIIKTAQYFPKEVQVVIEECNKVEGKDPVDTAINFVKCFEEKSPIQYNIESVVQ